MTKKNQGIYLKEEIDFEPNLKKNNKDNKSKKKGENNGKNKKTENGKNLS